VLNKRPIFIVAFARGGSSLVLNLLRSHPEVCSPRGEANEVFYGKRRLHESPFTVLAKRWRSRSIFRAEGKAVFRLDNWEPRRPFAAQSQQAIDRILYHEKMRATAPDQNRYKMKGVRYTRGEIERSRLLCKNLNGLIFLSGEFARLYPDATFVGLVRNGLAVCEGHIRRGHDCAEIARNYNRACLQMAHDAQCLPNFHIFRYEDLVVRPQEALRMLFAKAGLDLAEVKMLRTKPKAVMTTSGRHRLLDGGFRRRILGNRCRDLLWHPLEDFGKHLLKGVNANQIKRLSEQQRKTIVEVGRESLARFGYLDALEGKPARRTTVVKA